MANQLTGLKGRELKAAKQALVRSGRLQYVRNLIKQGLEATDAGLREKKLGMARRYSTTYELPYEDMLEEGRGGKPAAPLTVPASEPVPISLRVETPAFVPLPVAIATDVPAIADSSPAAVATEIEPGGGIATINGWPVSARAEVWRYPRNLRMVIIKLPDDREASLWNSGPRRRPLGSRLKVKLVEAAGDPIYESDE